MAKSSFVADQSSRHTRTLTPRIATSRPYARQFSSGGVVTSVRVRPLAP
jgi:hypothetical protein